MNENETLKNFRVLSFLTISICLLIVSSFYCFISKAMLDKWVLGYLIDFVFFLIFIFELEFERKNMDISDNYETTFSRISVGIVITSVLVLFMYFLPVYFRPVLILAIIMMAVGNDKISIVFSTYFSVLMVLFTSGNVFELAAYVFLIVLGSLWIRHLGKEGKHFFVCFFIGLMSWWIPELFVWMEFGELSLIHIIYGAIIAVITFFLCYFFYRKVRYNNVNELQNAYQKIMEDDYFELHDLKKYKPEEYAHARLVANLCYKYSMLLGLDSYLCASAGFYYRIGRWKGKPYYESSIYFSKKNCFPAPLIKIISEYYGEANLPSTRESALVHMVDATVSKAEEYSRLSVPSEWNLEMLIYQHLNEFSQAGLYDESGLSMNLFLKIREYLVKEEKINEFLSGKRG